MSNKEVRVKNDIVKRDRKRFAAALGLFFVWVAVLVGLAVKSGYRPMDRAGMSPASAAEVEVAPE